MDNNCALLCDSHADCAPGQDCVPAVEDGTQASIFVCRANGKAALGTACPDGDECGSAKACSDGSPCESDGDCTKGRCRALRCKTTGVGDASAYCTTLDCTGDNDCPGGYACGVVRVANQICGQPVPPSFCGTAPDACVDLSENEANGTTYAAGEICTERNECQIRELCDACATDLDCSLVAGQRCVNGSCATACGSDADCQNGFQCTSGACVPRSGSCAPSAAGQGAFCDTCHVDSDCGPDLICAELVHGGLHACLLAASISCTTDTECPVSATGLHASCYDGQCLSAPLINSSLNLFACWCQNSGASCVDSSDCCSGQCGEIDETGYGVCQ